MTQPDDSPLTLICVLGMHRSGTSCLSGCLEERGLQLGEVVNKATYNRKGNKENLEFRAVNDAVLAESGGAWDRPPERLVWNDDLRARRQAYLDAHATFGTWGVKDPRTLLTLPFWQEAALDLRSVGTFRHPVAVARSLNSRPGMEPATPALELWKAYNTALLEAAQVQNIPLICFDQSADAYLSKVNELARRIGLDSDTTGEAGDFFEEDFRHHPVEELHVDAEAEPYMDLYEALLRHAL
ncbi:MAG: hypothetical protein WBF53_06095 [Litorimonas sp.]